MAVCAYIKDSSIALYKLAGRLSEHSGHLAKGTDKR